MALGRHWDAAEERWVIRYTLAIVCGWRDRLLMVFRRHCTIRLPTELAISRDIVLAIVMHRLTELEGREDLSDCRHSGQ